MAVLQLLADGVCRGREIHPVRLAAAGDMLEPPMVEGIEMGILECIPIGRGHVGDRREDGMDEGLADIGIEDDLVRARVLNEIVNTCDSTGKPRGTGIRWWHRHLQESRHIKHHESYSRTKRAPPWMPQSRAGPDA